MIEVSLKNLFKEYEKADAEAEMSFSTFVVDDTGDLVIIANDSVVGVLSEDKEEYLEGLIGILADIIENYDKFKLNVITKDNKAIELNRTIVNVHEPFKMTPCVVRLQYTVENKFVEFNEHNRKQWVEFSKAFADWFLKNAYQNYVESWFKSMPQIKVFH